MFGKKVILNVSMRNDRIYSYDIIPIQNNIQVRSLGDACR